MLRRAILSVYEFYLLVRAAPAYAERYKKQTIIVIVFGAIWLVTKFAGIPWFEKDPETKELIGYASQVSFAITAVATGWAFLTLLAGRFPNDELVCREVTSEARYYPPLAQLYELVETYQCLNRTDGPVINIAPFADAYSEVLQSWNAEASIVATKSNTNAVVNLGPISDQPRNVGGGRTVHFYQRDVFFQPSLDAGDYCLLQCKITARGNVEAAAFTPDGTVFARGVRFNTLVYKMSIRAPDHYKVVLLGSRVLNADFETNEAENDRRAKPKVSRDETELKWRVTLARQQLRYALSYRFEPR